MLVGLCGLLPVLKRRPGCMLPARWSRELLQYTRVTPDRRSKHCQALHEVRMSKHPSEMSAAAGPGSLYLCSSSDILWNTICASGCSTGACGSDLRDLNMMHVSSSPYNA